MKKISGFTLIELFAVIAVAGVLVSLGVPSLKAFIQKGKLTTFGNELVAAMQVARSSAIQMGAPACVCTSVTAGVAVPACDGGNNWEDGWIAFIDTNNGAINECVYEPASGDILLKIWDGVAASNEITFRSDNATINALNYVRFNPRGNPVTGNGVITRGMFKLCDGRGLNDGASVYGKGIILSASGSLRTTTDVLTIASCL